jgi:ribA/ribD-fused uncharacterized protein
MQKIDAFEGDYFFLSNFFPSQLRFNGWVLPTVEHGFAALKATTAHDREYVLSQKSPGAAKRAGRTIKLREDWEEIKIPAMELLVWSKFSQDKILRDLLVETGDAELVEGNYWGDTVWGVCNGKGSNYLGKILMRTRFFVSVTR